MPARGSSRKRTRRKWLGADIRRAMGICLLFGLASAVGVGTVIQSAPFLGAGPGLNGPAPADDTLATAPIILVPVLGNNCRKKLIDNATWRIRDHGNVECRVALARNAFGGELGWSASRLDVVRDGFYRR